MKVVYLTIEEVVKIHEDMIKETGGHPGIISYGNLDFTVNQAKIPKNIERIATTLFYGILTSHPFIDGNKRTAISVLETFLEENDARLVAKNEELWNIVHIVSEGKLKFEEVVKWIKEVVKW
ncbi:MAG: type II toxin-antitoxin system death-on-curing family toxin [Candidatus Aenigmarchaeota archaeon]|nr:type II toxin-antitoxin system death-on-curing family toxin [Candidatus Aenigmarchaeota archaeon]